MSLAARSIRDFVNRTLSPAALSASLAAFARQERDKAIQSGRASPQYETIVNGVKGGSEDRVRPDGVIVYTFSRLAAATQLALSVALERSPRGASGDYRRAWMVAVNGVRYTGDLRDIPANAEVMIVNSLPYHRMLEMALRGGPKTSRKITEKARQAVFDQFGRESFDIERTFVTLTSAFQLGTYETPYVLKGRQKLAKRNAQSSVFRRGGKYLQTRKDRTVSSIMIYPAIIIKAK